jgi:hypothetical protein
MELLLICYQRHAYRAFFLTWSLPKLPVKISIVSETAAYSKLWLLSTLLCKPPAYKALPSTAAVVLHSDPSRQWMMLQRPASNRKQAQNQGISKRTDKCGI